METCARTIFVRFTCTTGNATNEMMVNTYIEEHVDMDDKLNVSVYRATLSRGLCRLKADGIAAGFSLNCTYSASGSHRLSAGWLAFTFLKLN